MDRPRDPRLAARLFGSDPRHALALMRAAWPAVVGPELARRTEVLALDAGVLRVGVPDETWRRGLARMRRELLGKLYRIAGGAAPRQLGFVVEPGRVLPPPPAASAPAASTPVPPPSVVDAAAGIPDAALRARFLESAARYLARFAPPDGEAPGLRGEGPSDSASN